MNPFDRPLPKSARLVCLSLVPVLAGVVVAVALGQGHPSGSSGTAAATPQVERGKYLVNAMGCNHCHTPFKMGENGPEQDWSRRLSGHPESVVMPPAPAIAMPWGAAVSATFTAWSGPWGTSFTANLTPDPETGLGKWTKEDFVAAMKSGRHQGRGRPILPPMPYEAVAGLTDEDIDALFNYLQTVPAVKNKVPEPIPPAAPGK